MHLPQDAANQQADILAVYRRNLARYLEQKASFDIGLVPQQILNGILEARENIARIKTNLRLGGYTANDEPQDTEPPRTAPAVAAAPSGHHVRLTIDVIVHDLAALKAYASRVYTRAAPGTTIESHYGKRLRPSILVLEALVLSNENPSADTYGIEIDDYRAVDL